MPLDQTPASAKSSDSRSRMFPLSFCFSCLALHDVISYNSKVITVMCFQF